MKMIIYNVCPMCGKKVDMEESHNYVMTRSGKRKVKQYFHTICFGVENSLRKVNELNKNT